MSETEVAPNQTPSEATGGVLDVASKAARDGAANAREAATRTWDATSLFVSRFVYTTCYTISYGVVFPTTLLALSIPRNNAAVRGLIDGAHAAIQKVDQLHGQALETQHADAPALAPA